MLAAKAVQHNRMYNGQESSTRYLDMKLQRILNPLGTPLGEEIQRVWMQLYTTALEILVAELTEKYPRKDDEKESVYLKAIKARAFDIARGFLPAGCTTYVGWHSNIRQAWDHIRDLRHHPLEEIRNLADLGLASLREKYPHSFKFKLYEEQECYLDECKKVVYEDAPAPNGLEYSNRIVLDEFTDERRLQIMRILSSRPRKSELPESFERFGQIQFKFLLDFGSFRDLQRHRSCVQTMPLLTTRHGFHHAYFDEMPERLKYIAGMVLDQQVKRLAQIEDPLLKQYYIAMGYKVACEVTAGLPSAVYTAELRSGKDVHFTLRPIAQKMGEVLKTIVPEMAIHCDNSTWVWSVGRGTQDIVKKSE
jgi:hypothetical protein